jgi:hypothetical protein
MRFKVVGVLLLAVAAYLAVSSAIAMQQLRNDPTSGEVQALLAIFLVLLVRILQTEKHHRDWLKAASDQNEKNAPEEAMPLTPLEELTMPSPIVMPSPIGMRPPEEEVLHRDPLFESE